MPRKNQTDYFLLTVILVLVVWGLVMVFSASAILADNTKRFGFKVEISLSDGR